MPPSSLVNSFSDPDDYGAAVQATTGAELTITGRGHFAATLTRIRLHHLWMQRLSETLPRVADVTVVAGRAVVMFRTEPGPALLWDGMEVHQTNIVRLSEGQRAFHRSAGPASYQSMSLPIEMMASAGAEMGDCDLTPPHGTLLVTPPPAAMARLQRLHASVGVLAGNAPHVLTNPEAARGAEQSLIEAMVACLASAEPHTERVPHQHRAVIIRRFRRLLDGDPDRPHYIPEICAVLRVSQRMLRASCHEYLGMGPHRYLAFRRMHLARRALRNGDPGTTNVTEVAMRFGFWQLGRFAVEYKALFGESPSATLAHAQARATPIPIQWAEIA